MVSASWQLKRFIGDLTVTATGGVATVAGGTIAAGVAPEFACISVRVVGVGATGTGIIITGERQSPVQKRSPFRASLTDLITFSGIKSEHCVLCGS